MMAPTLGIRLDAHSSTSPIPIKRYMARTGLWVLAETWPNKRGSAPSRPIANKVRENCSMVVSRVAIDDRITASDAASPPARPSPDATARL